jgi:hypothetical protein
MKKGRGRNEAEINQRHLTPALSPRSAAEREKNYAAGAR